MPQGVEALGLGFDGILGKRAYGSVPRAAEVSGFAFGYAVTGRWLLTGSAF